MAEKHNSKNPSIIGVLLGAIFVNVAFIRDEAFYAFVGAFMLFIVFVGELDMYLSRRAGRDPDKDYIMSDGEEGMGK